MDPIQVYIPDAKPVFTELDRRDADHIIAALREAGVDPRKAIDVPMIVAIAREWQVCRVSRGEMVHSFRNLLILNPALAEGGAA